MNSFACSDAVYTIQYTDNNICVHLNSYTDEEKKTTIIDSTETNLVALRRTIYLTIQSSLDFEECSHKLLKMQLKPGQEVK
jgi:hypothetical protein